MSDLYKDICRAITDRRDWAQRQRVWDQIRNSGLRRINKPYPNAPDMHFPLVDASIDKHKPFYVQQIYATETLAAFVSQKPQQGDVTSQVGAWFDYKVKQQSNFEREAICAIDTLLQNGGCPVKVFWSNKSNRLEFDACDPLHVIVPKWTKELPTADFLVHVLHLSEAQYRWNNSYKQNDDFIKSIKGRGTRTGDEADKDVEVSLRDGLTCGQNDDQIVLWEIYTRDPSDWNKIIVKTRSPLQFEDEVRADFEMPYSEGVFKEGWFPLVKWRGEIKDKGYYSPRGLTEIQAPFEQSLSKLWNWKHEWMDFNARPMFEQDPQSPAATTGNFKSAPGAIVPAGLKAYQPPGMPTSMAEEMNNLREFAEYRVQTPDFGVLQEQGGKRTATEISAIAGQTGQGTDLKSRIFRLDLADTYWMAWSILLQYGKDDLTYVLNGDPMSLQGDALQDAYEIRPNGSADSWNKGAQMQKAVNRFQMFKGSPFVKQGELTKSVLELDDPGLIPRLYQEPQDEQADQYEAQAVEILVMNEGLPAKVDAQDDDKTHLMCLAQYVEQTVKNGEPLTPRDARLYLQHGAQHTDALMQKKDPQVKQINQQFAPIIQILSQIAAQPDPREMPNNVLPMQGQMPSNAPQSAPAGPAAPPQASDAAKQVPALMQGLAALKKSGVPITFDDVNVVLAKAGLPPLQASPPVPAVTPSPQAPPQIGAMQ